VRLGTVLVRGASMLPGLRDGDCLVVRHGARPRPGDVVVARLHARPGLLVVKRAVAALDGGWLLASDNAAAPGAVGGPGDVEAVVLGRYWPLPPVRLGRGPSWAAKAAWDSGGPGSPPARRRPVPGRENPS